MELFTFYLAGAFLAFMLYLAYSRGAYGFAYLAMGIAIVTGMILLTDGVSVQTGTLFTDVGSNIAATATYSLHTASNDFMIRVIGMILFYGGIIGVVLSTLLLIKQ